MLKNHKRALSAAILSVAVIVAAACCIFTSSAENKTRYAYGDDGVTQINLAYYYDFQWTIDGYNTELFDGNVYRYRYVYDGEWHDYYAVSPLASPPDSDWDMWSLESVNTVARSIVDYHSSGTEHRIGVIIPMLSSNDYSVTYEGVTAEGDGEFIAKATIKLNREGYGFIYDLNKGTAISGRGMSVVIDSDTTASVTKVWYVAHFDNALLDEAKSKEEKEEVGYFLPSWTFGRFPQGVKAPRLQHGDEIYGVKGFIYNQPDNYWLSVIGYDEAIIEIDPVTFDVIWLDDEWKSGKKDIVTFELKRNGLTICSDVPRSMWSYYVNEYTPSGSYTVKFTAKAVRLGEHNAWWNEDFPYGIGTSGTEYSGFSREYSFEVYAAELAVDDVMLNAYGKEDAPVYEVGLKDISDGNFSAFFSVVDGKISCSQYIGADEVKKSGTYWSLAGVTETFFAEEPTVTFNVANMHGDGYMPGNGDWSAFINEAGLYTVFYRVEMPNYTSVSGSERYTKFFKVEVTKDGNGSQGGNSGNNNGSANSSHNTGLIVGVCIEAAAIAALGVLLAVTYIKLRQNGKSDV